MRPGQNNKRMRGRPTNNRRGPNPLTRSYESNGPDVKIRGNAHHVAEKYLQLARDAHTSGDPVAAENYLQHAEHYFRLIAAAQAAQLAAQGRAPGEPEPEDADDDDDGGVMDRFASPPERVPPFNPQAQQQPYAPPPPQQPNSGGYGYNNDRQPYDGENRQQQHGDRNNNNNYQPRGDRPQQNRPDNRPPRPQFGERNDNNRDYRNNSDNRNSDNRQPREFRNNYGNPQRDALPPPPPPPVEVAQPVLPAFITAAPRIPVPVEALETPQPIVDVPIAAPEAVEAAPTAAIEEAHAESRAPAVRGRRRRLRSPYGFQAGGDEAPATTPDGVPPTD